MRIRCLGSLLPYAGASAILALPVALGASPAPRHGVQGHKPAMHRMQMRSRYGGPSYGGAPQLTLTASLVDAGGGPAHFSAAQALTSMVGKSTVDAEVGKLTKQYGKEKAGAWLKTFDFAVDDALRLATQAGVKLPRANLRGKRLAAALAKAGEGPGHTFYVEYMLDKLLSHGIHETVMDDIDKKLGATADADFHRITNQAMVDVAHALGARNIKLASFH